MIYCHSLGDLLSSFLPNWALYGALEFVRWTYLAGLNSTGSCDVKSLKEWKHFSWRGWEVQDNLAPVRKRSLIHAGWEGDGRREAKITIAARKSCSADCIKLGIRKASGKCSLFFVVKSYSAKKWFLLFITTMFRFLVVVFWKAVLLYLWDRCNYKKTVFLVSKLSVNIPEWKASACIVTSICGQTSVGFFLHFFFWNT